MILLRSVHTCMCACVHVEMLCMFVCDCVFVCASEIRMGVCECQCIATRKAQCEDKNMATYRYIALVINFLVFSSIAAVYEDLSSMCHFINYFRMLKKRKKRSVA